MRISSDKPLKRGVPIAKGFEVKSASFQVQLADAAKDDLASVIKTQVLNWLHKETGCSLGQFDEAQGHKLEFANEAGKVSAQVAYESQNSKKLETFEFQSVNPFFRGVETTRLRFIKTEVRTDLEISTYMDSKDSSRAIHEIPRIADSLVAALVGNPELLVTVDGTRVSSSPSKVDSTNVKKSPLAAASKMHRLPLIGFQDNPGSCADLAARVALETAGLAQVLLVSDQLFGKTRRSFFIYWRDGIKGVEWHNDVSDLYKVTRQIYLRSLRAEDFLGKWRAAQSHQTATSKIEVISPEVSDTSQEEVVRLQIELEKSEQDLQAALRSIRTLEFERDSFISEFDETQKRWTRALEEGQKKNAKLFALGARQEVDLEQFQIQPMLAGPGIDAMFADLTATTQGAIVFSERVAGSWREADKRGYGKPEPLEKALEKLCRFAIAYRLAKGNLGVSRKQFAQKFDLELIEADSERLEKNFTFEGKVYNQEHHIRADHKKATFRTLGRIHFDFDLENCRIVVNHVGGKQYENDK